MGRCVTTVSMVIRCDPSRHFIPWRNPPHRLCCPRPHPPAPMDRALVGLLPGRTRPSMQENSTKKIYDVHSMFYDATFGRLVRRRIERAINHMNIQDTDLVLDLGIGTGVSL